MNRRAVRGLVWGAVGILVIAGTVRQGDATMERDLEQWIGRYAMELRVGSNARLPLLPTDRSTTVSHLLVDLRQDPDGAMVQRHQVCAVRMDNSSLMRTTVPPTFLNALDSRQYAVRLHNGSGGWRYEADMGLDHIGFDPRASGGALPSQPGDPGVIDADGDGNPGATIEIRVPLVGRGRLFIAQRTHLVLRAREASPERVEGSVEIRLLEQTTLGAEPNMFRRTPDVRPDPGRSGFTLVRLPENYGCAELTARAASLFAAAPRTAAARAR